MGPSQVFLVCMFAIRGANAACYFPNGTEHDGGGQAPCDSTRGIASMCCNLENTTTAGHCRTDGLCIPYNNAQLFRGPCTDPTWKDPACLPLCIDGTGKNS